MQVLCTLHCFDHWKINGWLPEILLPHVTMWLQATEVWLYRIPVPDKRLIARPGSLSTTHSCPNEYPMLSMTGNMENSSNVIQGENSRFSGLTRWPIWIISARDYNRWITLEEKKSVEARTHNLSTNIRLANTARLSSAPRSHAV